MLRHEFPVHLLHHRFVHADQLEGRDEESILVHLVVLVLVGGHHCGFRLADAMVLVFAWADDEGVVGAGGEAAVVDDGAVVVGSGFVARLVADAGFGEEGGGEGGFGGFVFFEFACEGCICSGAGVDASDRGFLGECGIGG